MNIQKMMQEAQKLKNAYEKKMKEFEEQEFTVKYKEYVSISIGGNFIIKSIEIAPSLVDPDDTETLNDIIVSAINQAYEEIKAKKQEISNSLAPGLGGMF